MIEMNYKVVAKINLNMISVKDVEVTKPPNLSVDFGSDLTINLNLNGGRSPHLVKLYNNDHSGIINWTKDNQDNSCTGVYSLQCSVTVLGINVDFTYDGQHDVEAKNIARGNAEISTTENFTVTVYKVVKSSIVPGLFNFNNFIFFNQESECRVKYYFQ